MGEMRTGDLKALVDEKSAIIFTGWDRTAASWRRSIHSI